MKLSGGYLSENIEIDPGEYEYVEIPCRPGSVISIRADETEGDDFNVYLLQSKYVTRKGASGDVEEYQDQKAVWREEKTDSVETEYKVDTKDVYFVIFDNYHAKSKPKSIEIEVGVEHVPLKVGDQPLKESFEVEAGCIETIDADAKAGDMIRVFGRVTKGNDINISIVSKAYETQEEIDLDKAYYTKEKAGDFNIEYSCTKNEPLLIAFDNGYSRRTPKTVDVSVQVVKGVVPESGDWTECQFCHFKNQKGARYCTHCGAKL